MKKNLQLLFNECLDNATDEELQAIKQLLDGVRRKQTKDNGSFIGGIYGMKREMRDGKLEVTMPITPVIYNSLGIVHGGVTATLIDSAMGTLANIVLPDEYGAVTTNLTIHYLAPGKGEQLTAKATIVHRGSKTLVIEGSVLNDDGKAIAHCTGSFFIFKRKNNSTNN
ncbi:PaaI family thioesterase [Bacillus seohaeanensis]|uniref:PaaI family thioesterase n=1 Tax=Bacillus seohaeanensis TaxID=284580 RepID=A0ABW5RR74_9BACI